VLAFWLRHTRRRERVFIDPKARGFAVHLFAYVAVILLLFIVNLSVTPKVWWFWWRSAGALASSPMAGSSARAVRGAHAAKGRAGPRERRPNGA
jgi:hypothetical protein